jgi:transcriptional accessory protein Tex/SPT6
MMCRRHWMVPNKFDGKRFSEDAKLLGDLRECLSEHGLVKSQVMDGKQAEGEKFRDYFDFSVKKCL